MSQRGKITQKKIPKSRILLSSPPDSANKMKSASSASLAAMKLDLIKNRTKTQFLNHFEKYPPTDCNFSQNDSTPDEPQSPPTPSRGKCSPESRKVMEKGQISAENDNRDDEFVDPTTRQLYLAKNQMIKLQTVLKRAEERLRSKDQEIVRLKQKVKGWEAKSKIRDPNNEKEALKKTNEVENSAYLYKRCLGLEHKIFEMERFLADYGLVWIGNAKNRSSKNPDYTSNDVIMKCYSQLIANIEELNMSIGKDEIHVQRNQDGGGASFKTLPCMCLKFYKNGMMTEEGKLRPYTNTKTAAFIRDILDGYFPSELQKDYPNGVPFTVEDHRNEHYHSGDVGFPGFGHRLGKTSAGPQSSMTTNCNAPSLCTTTSQHKSPRSNVQNIKKYSYNFKTGLPVATASFRSANQKLCSELSSADLLDLRSRILASHNNSCSYSHIQSHINAELGRNERKRTSAAKAMEYQMTIKEKSLSSKHGRTESVCPTSRSKTSQHGSIDRLTLGSSTSRFEKSSVRLTPRRRSTSLNSERYSTRSYTRYASPIGNEEAMRNLGCTTSGKLAMPRTTRSATLPRNDEVPIIREINKPTGAVGEFRLKIRSMNGSTVFLVHLSADDTVERLYLLLNRALATGLPRHYKIVISGYERKRLDEFGATLGEYGISRDSVLHLVTD